MFIRCVDLFTWMFLMFTFQNSIRQRGSVFQFKGYWWFHQDPPGPTQWSADCSLAHWSSNRFPLWRLCLPLIAAHSICDGGSELHSPPSVLHCLMQTKKTKQKNTLTFQNLWWTRSNQKEHKLKWNKTVTNASQENKCTTSRTWAVIVFRQWR